MTGLLVEPARPRAVREHRLAPWFAVATVCFGAFMGQLDASIVTLAFPALQRQFTAALAAVQWVSLAYLITLVALLVPVGRWSDRAGRKLVYLGGFAVFTAASAACGLAGSLTALIGLRVVQALGAAMLQANSVALVATSAPAGRRRAALGVQAAAQSLGLALGPTLGGALVASIGWRWIFLINVPVGVVALVAGRFLLPRTRHRAAGPAADPVGLVLLTCAATALLVALSSVSGLALSPAAVAALAVIALIAAGALVWWERRASAPLLDLTLLSTPAVGGGLLGALAAYLVLFGPLVLFAQTLTTRTGGELRAGALLTALPAGFGLAAVATERVLPAGWSDRRRCLAGGLLAAVAAAALALPDLPESGRGALLGLLGVGLGTFIPANNVVIMAAVPGSLAATAGGMVNMARALGTALGVAVVTLVLYLGGGRAHPAAGSALTMAVLAAAALVAAGAGRAAARGRGGKGVGGGR
ncbi:MFS transporter [Planosporangium thailandense]|uniref:MFS transporter n=1 Tax=Planosporangium thailandense TaxID=765197 RepID=A0ABX0Y7X3_9ACTN|nr:MFS transporter [Planosporangium thailandense]NJC73523.1 MFS transporter [Planosporangium thailandense]